MILETRLPATDGFPLAATIIRPDGAAELPAVVISSAIATPRRFYAGFARYLCDQGFAVATYDYRGVGESRPDTLRGFDVRLLDWAEKDMAGVIAEVQATLRPTRVFHLGHSLGGQVAGLLPNRSAIDAMVTVSAQSGYWALHPGWEKARVWFFTRLAFPALTALFGYMPWRRIAGGEDLPKRAAREWAAWCQRPGYLLDDPTLPLERYATFTAPILAYSFSDDVWGSERSVRVMMSAYTASSVEQRHVDPASLGLDSLGHLGFFKPKARALWDETVAWLRRAAEPPAGSNA